MKKILFLVATVSLFIACNNKDTSVNKDNSLQESLKTELTTAEKIANNYGFKNWKDVSELQFTFNVLRKKMPFSRSWKWNVKTNDVVMTSATDTISYNRNSVDSLSLKFDKAFINDKYWLMAPFNLVSDKGITFTEKQNVIAPISKDTLHLLTITYNKEGGYTPGDAYDFFYNSNYEIKEWNFRKGNLSRPSLSTTWEENKEFEKIIFSTMHKDETGLFKVFFTDVAVKY